MKLYKFRALLSLDPAEPGNQARVYPCGTHCLMVAARRIGAPGVRRYFPAAIYRTDEQSLRRGDRSVIVTIEIADDDACAFLGPGQHVTIWNGCDIGHAVISRRVFFTWAA